MANYEFFLASALEKVFPAVRPEAMPSGAHLSAWRGTRASVQLVYRCTEAKGLERLQKFDIEVEGAPVPVRFRSVELIPSDMPCYHAEDEDDYFITKEPGLFPDLLKPMESSCIRPLPEQYRSIWLSMELPANLKAGNYEITVTAKALDKDVLGNGEEFSTPAAGTEYPCRFTLCVGKAVLPEQTLIHTEWFHADCLADYYHVKPFSEEHWRILENFISAAGEEHGINMLLTPVFTPPLDTEVGGERTTVQLVDVSRNNGVYSFDFEKLRRWARLCREHKVSYLEISHLFTQWGAAATPKIMAVEDGVEKRIFGWDVPAVSEESRSFLQALLPRLQQVLAEEGFDREHVYYHISDEPNEQHADAYRAAKAQTDGLLDGCPVIDALSSYDFYRQGLVKHPVPSNDHIGPFLEAGVPHLWTYYCCSQYNRVPNRFFAMPSARSRIMGVLMYLWKIEGFLQWGYNFYSAQFSKGTIDPYTVTHANYAFPSGDAYLVYPAPDGTAYSSVRAEVQDDALTDLRALQHLERLAGRKTVEAVIYENAPMRPMTFKDYPHDAEYLLQLRERVAEEIEKYTV